MVARALDFIRAKDLQPPRTMLKSKRPANEGALETYSSAQQGLIGPGDEEAPAAETNPNWPYRMPG
ncbi:hypothetical protein ACJ72_02058 [Emergomyces africanus]|uniref:Uncharacterized protein n=1 Tax=Emergomyces africanus TaxID=1955775 RepID=A0A1B7P3I4_9EURO|nr:hypothetical protein ACJ72_02058 [Emergomyces africanus]